MKVLQTIRSAWKEDPLLRRVVKNSSFLFGSNTIAAVLIFIQGILAVRMIGVSSWGLVATIITFVTNVNRLLSFRMSEVVAKRLSQAMAKQDRTEAAAVVKTAGAVEVSISILAFLVLVILAPWAARTFAKDVQSQPWFVFYGLILLSNIVYETSAGVIQTLRRFDRLARLNLIQSVVTFLVIAASFLLNLFAKEIPSSILVRNVILAYVLGKTYLGLSIIIVALQELKNSLGAGWWHASWKALSDKRGMAGFMLNTNLNGTVLIFVRDNIPLYMAALLSTMEVGYLKIAMTLINPIMLILDPFIGPTYVEIAHSIAERAWEGIRRLLRRVSILATVIVMGFGGGAALVGWWLIPTLYGADARPAYPALLILMVGYGVAGIFQWSRTLLLSLGKSGFPLLTALLVGAVELALIFWLVPRCGYLAMTGILTGYFVVFTAVLVWRGLSELSHQERAAEAAAS